MWQPTTSGQPTLNVSGPKKRRPPFLCAEVKEGGLTNNIKQWLGFLVSRIGIMPCLQKLTEHYDPNIRHIIANSAKESCNEGELEEDKIVKRARMGAQDSMFLVSTSSTSLVSYAGASFAQKGTYQSSWAGMMEGYKRTNLRTTPSLSL
jgi:hypothetical protein